MVCPLCKAIENEDWIKIDEHHALLIAKTLKGHKKRYIFTRIQHNKDNFFKWKEYITKKLLARALTIGFMQFKDEDFYILFGDKQSIKDHWHVILCDTHFKKDKGFNKRKERYIYVQNRRD